MKKFLFLLLLPCICFSATIHPGADQMDAYLPLLKNKRVAIFANPSSRIGKTPLVDKLLEKKINIIKIFSPEHGFRGDVDEFVSNSRDTKTGLPIVSLYGKKLSPTPEDLIDVDILIFDIQDVGVRFYTYISSLQKLMEAAVKNNKPLIILDRPNPNGFYVDGPVLEPKFKSFTGMQPIPIVYGMTMGEYAKMLVGEEWLNLTPTSLAKDLNLTVIPCKNYTHKSHYVPPIKPSPNLYNIQSIYLYPALGMMESTVLSVGRGTKKPLQIYGHPLYKTKFTFIPRNNKWAPHPPYMNKVCRGWDLSGSVKKVLKEVDNKLQIKYLIKAYQLFPHQNHFFAGFSDTAGNDVLQKQIMNGVSEKEIRASWQPALDNFKKIRKKYLLYPDFE